MLNILLIEDSDTDAEMIERALEKHMKTVVSTRAVNIEKAKELLKQQTFNLIILDLGLPDSASAADTYARISEAADKTPIMISSNLNDPIFIKAMAHRGAVAHFSKDVIAYRPEHVRNAITFALERHDMVKQAFNEKMSVQKEADDKSEMLNYLMGGYSVAPKPEGKP
jgi:DNA-binding response OmpR family regulator